MSEISRKSKKQATEHRKRIIKAANTYISSTNVTLNTVSEMFHVSGNEITSWFYEGISKGILKNEAACHRLIDKHIQEYESTFHIENSSLRQMYKEALTERAGNEIGKQFTNPTYYTDST